MLVKPGGTIVLVGVSLENISIPTVVTVMREIDGEVVLYSYDVPNDDLFKFMKSFDENTLDGTIIEIDKYFPEDLA